MYACSGMQCVHDAYTEHAQCGHVYKQCACSCHVLIHAGLSRQENRLSKFDKAGMDMCDLTLPSHLGGSRYTGDQWTSNNFTPL